MPQSHSSFSLLRLCLFAAGMVATNGAIWGQAKPAAIPDAQIEANVLGSLAGSPQLADQSITSTTAFGTVTLGGTVRDEESRSLADKLVSNTAGVRKVVDQMTIASTGSAGTPQNTADGVQSGAATSSDTQQPQGSASSQTPISHPQTYPSSGAGARNSSPQQPGQYPPYGGPSQPSQYPSQSGPQQSRQYPAPYGSPYSQPPNAPEYGQPQRPYVVQIGGEAVIVPNGSLVRVRINQGMDSKHTAVGTVFDGVVLNDVIAGGSIAIPRGAAIQGSVVESHPAGDLKGKGELKLQLTQLQLGGRVYPIVTDFWWHQGADKTANTVGNSVGLGAVGALIGAVAGGGVGAAVGAGIGGVAGLGVSASQRKGEAGLPPEAIVTFHLTQPADITTVSQAELNRLGAGVPSGGSSQMQRRYPPPPPPPYYGPAYYYPPPY